MDKSKTTKVRVMLAVAPNGKFFCYGYTGAKESKPMSKTETTFWQRLAICVVIYLAVGSFLAGACNAFYKNKCPNAGILPGEGLFILTWLPSEIGYEIWREKTSGELTCPQL